MRSVSRVADAGIDTVAKLLAAKLLADADAALHSLDQHFLQTRRAAEAAWL